MNDILRRIFTRRTPQRRPAEPHQVRNSAGGYTFEVSDLERLRRFVILGTEGGTYYVEATTLTLDNLTVLRRMATDDPRTLVDTVVEISESGAAARQNPAIFALAVAGTHADEDARRYALSMLPRVCRTGTHLFLFAQYCEQLRGWGRGLRRAVAGWYTDTEVEALAYQVAKYRQREGWSHRDLLRLAHPRTLDPQRAAVFDWVVRGGDSEHLPRLLRAFNEVAQAGQDPTRVATLVRQHRLSWEMLPDSVLNEPAVWEAMLDNGMPATALLRQLPRLTRLGVLAPFQARTAQVAELLTDADWLARGRIHPVAMLVALRVYSGGMSLRGDSRWDPLPQIVDALDAGFYAAFGAVEPAGKRTLIGLDVSGSMTARVSGLPLTCRAASTALCLVQLATEPQTQVVAFTAGAGGYLGAPVVVPVSLSPRQRLDDAIQQTDQMPFGGTDISLPMRYALERRLAVDTFVVYTDNESWAGPIHPHQALREYRERTGIPARLVVVAMTATRFSVADPNDAGMLDVVGFDAGVPRLVSDFSRGGHRAPVAAAR